jgi:hypothetical protein
MTDNLFTLPPDMETRWATAENPTGEKAAATRGNDGRKRAPAVAPLAAGASWTMAEASGRGGTVRRIWVTIPERNPRTLRGIRLDMYWDGAAAPAVSVPLGDFFCHGLGRMATFQNALFSSPEGRSFNACVPMPFRTGMKIVAINESGADIRLFFYEVDYTLGDRHGPDVLYFHSHWRRENPTEFLRDYQILPPVAGSGRYLGANIGVIADTGTYCKSWWGEGEVKVYLDGDRDLPTLCGTGTEDYIGTGWGQGQYAHPYQGCQLADHERFQYSFYRLHVPDPVIFRREIRVAIQQIGCWDPATSAQMNGSGLRLRWGSRPVDMAKAVSDKGYGLFERRDDWSSCAWFYLDRPVNGLPAIAPAADRMGALA